MFSKTNVDILTNISNLGHEIGLHFDEVKYDNPTKDMGYIKDKILEESKCLGLALGMDITTVSMHRPSKEILDSNLEIPGMINSYSKTFFNEFKYLSDSRRRWREPVEEIIESEQYNKLHILTHSFWYNDIEKDIQTSVKEFVNDGNKKRYEIFSNNITDIESIMTKQEIE